MARFHVAGTDREFDEMGDAAQEAECLHAETGSQHDVVANEDDEHGCFEKDEIVYSSNGGVE
jgi:hypothetical protein